MTEKIQQYKRVKKYNDVKKSNECINLLTIPTTILMKNYQ